MVKARKVPSEISSINSQSIHQGQSIDDPSIAQRLRNPAQSITIFCRGGIMAHLEGLVRIVNELRVERTNLANELKHVDAALAVLGKLDGGSSYTEPRRTLSASARKRISTAQKARWARVGKVSQSASGTAKTEGLAPVKRTMSASARRKIAAAQRARWAKVKAGKGAA
jgi:hypothetical protein